MNLEKATPVRCNKDRPHGQYELCGRLLCVVRNGVVYLRCNMCNSFFRLDIHENDNYTLTKVSSDKIDFELRTSTSE